ncbi:MAG: hypothetical protein IT450_19595 [Phycisphaerales bacterium]|nr:hypothetical protein [Phycisphaerales bacterium]
MLRIAATVTLIAAFVGLSGCGRAGMGISMFKNSQRVDSHLRVFLDGQEATQDQLEKTVKGHARFTVSEKVSTKPKLKFLINEPDKFGRITKVMVSIYQKFEADYSHQAEFTVFAKDANDPMSQMKPDTEYDLGLPGEGFKVIDLTGKEIPGIELKPGFQYMLNLTVVADNSETAQLFFETK